MEGDKHKHIPSRRGGSSSKPVPPAGGWPEVSIRPKSSVSMGWGPEYGVPNVNMRISAVSMGR